MNKNNLKELDNRCFRVLLREDVTDGSMISLYTDEGKSIVVYISREKDPELYTSLKNTKRGDLVKLNYSDDVRNASVIANDQIHITKECIRKMDEATDRKKNDLERYMMYFTGYNLYCLLRDKEQAACL